MSRDPSRQVVPLSAGRIARTSSTFAQQTDSPARELSRHPREGAQQKLLVLDLVDRRRGAENHMSVRRRTCRDIFHFGIIADDLDTRMRSQFPEFPDIGGAEDLSDVHAVEGAANPPIADRMLPLEESPRRKMELKDDGRAIGPIEVAGRI